MIVTPVSATSTADEVIEGIEGIDLTGRRAVVTGGAPGIGVETARALARWRRSSSPIRRRSRRSSRRGRGRCTSWSTTSV
jgi:hypothetical protein